MFILICMLGGFARKLIHVSTYRFIYSKLDVPLVPYTAIVLFQKRNFHVRRRRGMQQEAHIHVPYTGGRRHRDLEQVFIPSGRVGLQPKRLSVQLVVELQVGMLALPLGLLHLRPARRHRGAEAVAQRLERAQRVHPPQVGHVDVVGRVVKALRHAGRFGGFGIGGRVCGGVEQVFFVLVFYGVAVVFVQGIKVQ